MDPDEAPQPTSGIPRLSKLPLPRSTQAAPNDPPRRRPMSLYGTLPPSIHPTSTPAPKTDHSSGTAPNTSKHVPNGRSLANMRKPLSPPSKVPGKDATEAIDASTEAPLLDPSNAGLTRKDSRKSRLSLTDRTMETLSQIPPSPSPNRRKSGFFTTESPMRTPSRPTSAFSRPISKIGGVATNGQASTSQRSLSPSKSHSAMPRSTGSKLATPGRRAVTSFVGKYQSNIGKPGDELGKSKLDTANHEDSLEASTTPPLLQRQGTKPNGTLEARSLRYARTRPPSNLPDTNRGNVSSKPLRAAVNPPSKPNSFGNAKLARATSPTSPPKPPKAKSGLPSPTSKSFPQKSPATSSTALRQTIANAKAAKRAADRNGDASKVPRSLALETTLAGSDIDPFTLDLNESAEINILRKRINTARTDGRLNISGLGLTGIPLEVLSMYDSNATGSGGISWYECVDLVKLLASDNELTSLDPRGFPDVPHEDETFDDDDDERSSVCHVFALLQTLDLHGNRLSSLPLGIRRLNHLTVLNLFRNQLTGDDIDLISQIQSLRELRLGENTIKGVLPDCVGNMKALEILDVHNNGITMLPDLISRCTRLSSLDVSDNKLSSLPVDALIDLPLVELNASQNKLGGRLFPPKTRFARMRVLDVEENALTEIAGAEVDMPSLQTLNVSNNRIASMANIDAWKHVKTIIASRNQFTSVPENLFSLPLLETLDLQNNSITQIDKRLGSIVTLQNLRLEGNPLRERRLLTISTPDLLLELKTPETLLSPLSPKTPSPWTLTASTLDISRKKIAAIVEGDLIPFLSGEKEVRTLVLHQNALQTIPSSLSLLASTLTTLDLSSNKLSTSTSYLPTPLSLPHLHTLNLTSNALSTLHPLTSSLSAPALATLNISFNRLELLPPLRPSFPALTKVLASNNKIVELDVEAVRGLQVLDVSSNEIAHLPPRLAHCKGVLRTLMVNGNRFRVPGWGVLEKGTEEVLKWLETRIPAHEGEGEGDVD